MVFDQLPVAIRVKLADGAGDYSPSRDSKVLRAKTRRLLAGRIEVEALGVGFGSVSEVEIDQINILQASYKAMRQAVANLPIPPDVVLVDGFFLHGLEMPCIGIIGGDSRSYSIAAASIVAKVKRDALMAALASEYPQYGFDRNMGYGTEFHRRAIASQGASPSHRRTFRGVRARGGNDVQ